MATLTVIKGKNEGATFQLNADEIVLGREADCNVVINEPAVSRKHACIRRINGDYYIEDLKSRNHTYVNNEEVKAPVKLCNEDRIKICDYLLVFHAGAAKPALPPELLRDAQPTAEDEDGSSSTVEAMLNQSSKQILETQPAEKLAFLLEVASELSGTFDLDHIVPQIVTRLFQVFKQADRAFVVLAERDGNGNVDKLIPKVTRTRRGQDDSKERFSRNIVRLCLEEGKAILSEDATSDERLRDLSNSIANCRIRSIMCAPLKGRNDEKPFGVLQLDTQDRPKKFTQDDLKLLMAVAGQAAIALENARMHESLIRRAGLERDLQLAHQVQLSFLPKSPPSVPGYEFFAHYESAQEVGGDYYDFIQLPQNRIAAMIGDVAGKGVAAALLMAKVSSDARYTMLTEPGPAAAICKLNELLQEAGELDRFVTLEAALVDPARHEVTFVSAGHNPAVIYRRATGTAQEAFSHRVGGLPLGVMHGYTYDVCATLTLEPGDIVVMFSDGVTEAPNAAGHDFGLDGVRNVFRTSPSGPADVVRRLVMAVKQHSSGATQRDDITVVCFGRKA